MFHAVRSRVSDWVKRELRREKGRTDETVEMGVLGT